LIDGADRDTLDEQEPQFALCFTTKRILSEPKIVKNSRIVIVGASDTGISFIEALLSIGYLYFTNIVLIAPGGLPHHHNKEKNNNLKASSTSYTPGELEKLMLETRVRVIDSRMIDIDRSDKHVILHDDRVIPYDTLILAMGIQDKTLNSKDFVTRGIEPVPKNFNRMHGLLSIDDPFLYQILAKEAGLISFLTNRKEPQNVVLYGRSLHIYTLIQGLVQRGLKYEQITLVIPKKECHAELSYDEEELMNQDLPIINPDAFEDEHIEAKIHKILESKGLRIVLNARVEEILEDQDHNLEAVLFKLLDIPDDEEEEDELEGIEEKTENEGSKISGQQQEDEAMDDEGS
jgi:hypothetical protein